MLQSEDSYSRMFEDIPNIRNSNRRNGILNNRKVAPVRKSTIYCNICNSPDLLTLCSKCDLNVCSECYIFNKSKCINCNKAKSRVRKPDEVQVKQSKSVSSFLLNFLCCSNRD